MTVGRIENHQHTHYFVNGTFVEQQSETVIKSECIKRGDVRQRHHSNGANTGGRDAQILARIHPATQSQKIFVAYWGLK